MSDLYQFPLQLPVPISVKKFSSVGLLLSNWARSSNKCKQYFSLYSRWLLFFSFLYLSLHSSRFQRFPLFPHTTQLVTQLKPHHTSSNQAISLSTTPLHTPSLLRSHTISIMPSKIQLDENLWFLYICLQKSDLKSVRPVSSPPISSLSSLALIPPLFTPFALLNFSHTSSPLSLCSFHLYRLTSLPSVMQQTSSHPQHGCATPACVDR